MKIGNYVLDLRDMANPPLPRRKHRRRAKWVVTLVCDSRAEAMRVERFLKLDRAGKRRAA
jgi:hypothetical protein